MHTYTHAYKFRWQQEHTAPDKAAQHTTQCAAVLMRWAAEAVAADVADVCMAIKDGDTGLPMTAGRGERMLPKLTPDMLQRLRLRLRRRKNTRSCWRTSELSREASSSLAATMLRLQVIKTLRCWNSEVSGCPAVPTTWPGRRKVLQCRACVGGKGSSNSSNRAAKLSQGAG